MKISTVRAELLHTDRETDQHTDMMKLIVAFRNFANAANNVAKCNVSTVKVPPHTETRHIQTKGIQNTEATQDTVGLAATAGWSSNRRQKLHTKFAVGMRSRCKSCRLSLRKHFKLQNSNTYFINMGGGAPCSSLLG